MSSLSDHLFRESVFDDLEAKSIFVALDQFIKDSDIKVCPGTRYPISLARAQMDRINRERWARPLPLQDIKAFDSFCEGIVIIPQLNPKSRPFNAEAFKSWIKVRTEKSRVQAHPAPLDTETQWFVMPKDLKETSSGKSIGYQGECSGWSGYEDET